ncbi:MAG: YggS family pyridoxal phosphate-dependent enzyme [Acidobacteriia bacterium]|nr:YggS family pyridoxal phosphate-dependent enzyme [Terriglobia bacterium]
MEPRAARALEDVRRRIADACARARRKPASVSLVAVSKTFAAERVKDLLLCGQDLFGENRVQEALLKIPRVGPGARWHLVGHLQRNKARHAVGAFELIHSLDDLDLAREVARRATALGIVQPVLAQVNLSREATKSGTGEDDTLPLLEAAAGLAGLELRGLMTIPPPAAYPEESRPWFARLRELRDRAEARLGIALPELSMGMSDDFEVAVEEGATLVRVGRALFGDREASPA